MTTDPRITIRLDAFVPQSLMQKFLQHIRDFDTANAGCHFEILAIGGDLGPSELQKLFEGITPGFPIKTIIPTH